MNEGIYANEAIAQQWIAWVENLSDDIRDRELYPWLSAWLMQFHPRTILEIGSGQGVCSERIPLGSAEYIGVEPSAYLRERAATHYPSRVFLSGKAEKLPIDTASVDAAFSMFVWLHIEDLTKAASELARVLKPGGVFAIINPNPNLYDVWLSWQKNIIKEGKRVSGDFSKMSGHEMYLHTKEEITASCKEYDLELSEIAYRGYQNNTTMDDGFVAIFSGHKKQ